MSQTAVAENETGLPLKELAQRHGLTSAGRLPSLLEYTRDLWSYRHFIASFSSARVVANLGSTRLGMIWQVLTPLINATVYFIIFGLLMNASRGIHNFIAYLCIGVFIFGFTQSSVQAGVVAISGNLGLIRALHFPRASLPISTAMIEVRNILASMLVLFAIVLFKGEPITWQWLLLIPALLLLSIFNAGLTLFVARLGTKVHDIKQLIPFIMRIWMYVSAVIFPVTYFKEKLHGGIKLEIVEANPMLVFVEIFRHALMEDVPLASPPLHLWIKAFTWTGLVGLGGYVYFWRGEKEYGRG